MTVQALYDEFQKKCALDSELRALKQKIESGSADFSDTAAYSQRVSKLLGKTLSKHIDGIPAGEREKICKWLLQEQYKGTNSICEVVQMALDEAQGIHLKPVKPKFPAERVQQVAHALEDPTVKPEVIQRRANAPVANVSMSFHDDYIKENAKIRAKLGMKPTITRYGSGCCSWCSAVAGRYRFGDQPKDIFRRHDNCDCTIIYDNQVLRGRETSSGRSKTWEEVDPAQVEKLGFTPTINSHEQAKKLQEKALEQLTLYGERDILRLEAESPFKNPKTPLSIDSVMQSKHIQGGKRYRDYMQSHKYEPSYLIISEEKAQELVDKFHGTGILKLNQHGEAIPNEIIIDNDEIVGYVVNNQTGESQETSAFKIQYGKNGTHIVPTYESQKQYWKERRDQDDGHDWLLRQKS